MTGPAPAPSWIEFFTRGSAIGLYLFFQLGYLASYYGLFHFYRWARLVYTACAVLYLAVFPYLAFTVLAEDMFSQTIILLHGILVVVLLIWIWTPFVGGEFRRTAKDL